MGRGGGKLRDHSTWLRGEGRVPPAEVEGRQTISHESLPHTAAEAKLNEAVVAIGNLILSTAHLNVETVFICSFQI